MCANRYAHSFPPTHPQPPTSLMCLTFWLARFLRMLCACAVSANKQANKQQKKHKHTKLIDNVQQATINQLQFIQGMGDYKEPANQETCTSVFIAQEECFRPTQQLRQKHQFQQQEKEQKQKNHWSTRTQKEPSMRSRPLLSVRPILRRSCAIERAAKQRILL